MHMKDDRARRVPRHGQLFQTVFEEKRGPGRRKDKFESFRELLARFFIFFHRVLIDKDIGGRRIQSSERDNYSVLLAVRASECKDSSGTIRFPVELVSQPDLVGSGVAIAGQRIEILKEIWTYVMKFRHTLMHLENIEVRGGDFPVESHSGIEAGPG